MKGGKAVEIENVKGPPGPASRLPNGKVEPKLAIGNCAIDSLRVPMTILA